MEWVDRYTFLCTLQLKFTATAPVAPWNVPLWHVFTFVLHGILFIRHIFIQDTRRHKLASCCWDQKWFLDYGFKFPGTCRINHTIWKVTWQALLRGNAEGRWNTQCGHTVSSWHPVQQRTLTLGFYNNKSFTELLPYSKFSTCFSGNLLPYLSVILLSSVLSYTYFLCPQGFR